MITRGNFNTLLKAGLGVVHKTCVMEHYRLGHVRVMMALPIAGTE